MKKTVMSALCLIPSEEIWPNIQAIRKVHDKSYVRWMPHINLLYPFAANNEFPSSVHKVAAALKGMNPFQITYKKFDYFQHGARSFTMWLHPEENKEVIELQKRLVDAFPECNDLNTRTAEGFIPHLSVGQWTEKRTMEASKAGFLKNWTDLTYTCESVQLISRIGDEPFEVRFVVDFAGNIVAKNVVTESQSTTNVFVRNLPFKTTDNDLKAFFETLGYSVKTAKVCKDNLGRPRGFAFVDFATDTDAQKVVALGQVEFSDRTLSVAFANK